MKPIPAGGSCFSLRFVRGLCAAFALLLLAGIIWAASESNVIEGLRLLASERWGVVTLLDVYAGALVVALWMWVCERRVATWVLWVLALLCLGHLVSLTYLIVRTLRCRNLTEVISLEVVCWGTCPECLAKRSTAGD